MTEPLQLEWSEEPDEPRGNVTAGVLIWCGCGWRQFDSVYGTGKKGVAHGHEWLRRHREQWCPWRKGADES